MFATLTSFGILARVEGFEPSMTESESVALPLGDTPMFYICGLIVHFLTEYVKRNGGISFCIGNKSKLPYVRTFLVIVFSLTCR